MQIAKEFLAGMFIAIMAYLLIKDPDGTTKVIGAAGGGLTNTIATLQGRGVGNG